MFAKLTLALTALVVCSHAAPSPGGFGGGGHHKHVVIHVPYKVHTIHHHHVSKVPVYKEVHVPVYKEVPIIKHVPVIKHVPIVKHVEVEKPIYVPVPYKESKGWESQHSHGWL